VRFKTFEQAHNSYFTRVGAVGDQMKMKMTYMRAPRRPWLGEGSSPPL
jgi:hypothetical protein